MIQPSRMEECENARVLRENAIRIAIKDQKDLFPQGLTDATKALQQGLSDPDLCTVQVFFLRKLGNHQAARERLEEHLQRYPEETSLLLEKGMIEIHAKQYQSAIDCFRDITTRKGIPEGHASKAYRFMAYAMQEVGDKKSALITLDEACKRFPKNADVQAEYGELLYGESKYQDAINHLLAAHDLGRKSPGTTWKLLAAYRLNGDYKKAKDFYDRELHSSDAREDIMLKREYAYLLYDTNQYEEAARVLTEVCANESTDSEPLRILAASLRLKKPPDLRQAQTILRKALDASLEKSSLLLESAYLAVDQQRHQHALQIASRILRSDHDSFEAKQLQLFCLRAISNLSGKQQLQERRLLYAERLCQEALASSTELTPFQQASLQAEMGLIMMQAGKPALAIRFTEIAISCDPKDPRYKLIAAEIYSKNNELTESNRRLEEVLRQDPNHPDALLMHGVNCIQQKDYSQAETYLRTALSQDSQNQTLKTYLAIALISSATSRHAYDSTVRHRRSFPFRSSREWRRQILRKNQNVYQKTIQSLQEPQLLCEEARTSHDSHIKALALGYLGKIYEFQKKYQEAEKYYWLSMDADPGTGACCDLGLLYLKLNRSEAKETLEKALIDNPYNPEVLLGLAQSSELKGESEKAIAYCYQAKALYPQHAAICQSLLITLLNADRFDEAQREVEIDLRQLEPQSHYHTHLMNARVAIRMGEEIGDSEYFTRALSHIADAKRVRVEKGLDYPDCCHLSGIAHLRLSEYGLASAEFKRCLEQDPFNYEAEKFMYFTNICLKKTSRQNPLDYRIIQLASYVMCFAFLVAGGFLLRQLILLNSTIETSPVAADSPPMNADASPMIAALIPVLFVLAMLSLLLPLLKNIELPGLKAELSGVEMLKIQTPVDLKTLPFNKLSLARVPSFDQIEATQNKKNARTTTAPVRRPDTW